MSLNEASTSIEVAIQLETSMVINP
jgi:hypothetical protein